MEQQNSEPAERRAPEASPTVRIERTRTLSGPNIYHHLPVVVAIMRTDRVEPIDIDARWRLRDGLLSTLPAIVEHRCNAGHPGGFLEELDAGTSLAHVVEHVALELSQRAGVGVDFGRTIPGDAPGEHSVIVRARAEQTMTYLLEQSAVIVDRLLAGEPVELDPILEEAEAIRATTELGATMVAIVRAAKHRGIPTTRRQEEGLVQLGYGKHRRLVAEAPSQSDGDGIEVVGDPDLTELVRDRLRTAKTDDVGAAIVDLLYPDPMASRVPLVSITGTNGKTTVTRMIDHILRSEGRLTGMTTTDGIWIDGREVMRGDMTGPYSAQVVLSDPTVEVAVLETARGGIARRGLGYDWSDVGVLTNISGDHIGQDGIRSVDDLLEIKSLVAERVCPGGTIVLNADDPRLVALAARPSSAGRTIVFFSLDASNPVVATHVAAGGIAYVRDGSEIVELAADARFRVASIDQLPITLGGAADFQIANALAAVAAARELGVRPWAAARALASFRSDLHNPGRMNLFAVGRGYVLIDYGHNPDAFSTMARLARRWQGRRRTGIVGVPGDRDDATILESGRIVGGAFDRIILREDHDLRGRSSGETSRMLCDAVAEVAPTVDCRTVLDETKALCDAIATMEKGEVIFLFYEKLEPILALLQSQGARPVEAVATVAHTNGVAAHA